MIRNFLLSRLFICGVQPLLVAIACALHAPAVAQPPRQDALEISRECLWNSDRTIWSDLHVKRVQIAQLNEIRLRYPAVVNGQWITQDGAASPGHVPGQEQRGPSHGVGSPSGASPMPVMDLQAELRGVLTTEQLTRWHQLCAPPNLE